MDCFIFEIGYINPAIAYTAFQNRPYSLFFDSCDKGHQGNKFSTILIDPVEVLETFGSTTHVSTSEFSFSFSGNAFDIAKDRLASYGLPNRPNKTYGLNFLGGMAGMLGYGLLKQNESVNLKQDDTFLIPDMAVGIYLKGFVFNLKEQRAYIFINAHSEQEARIDFEIITAHLNNAAMPAASVSTPSWNRLKNKDDYTKDVAQVIQYIRNGDIFQANLSQRFVGQLNSGFLPYLHYYALRHINPAPYGCFAHFKGWDMASSSPELFLSVEGGVVTTRPIKGTSDKDDPDYLANSEKDRAENIMIVDLLRNDLSRVCTDDSVIVPELCVVEEFSGLNHMVSTIQGQLRPGMNAIDALKACFPGGSVTGAPKVRAMEIIEELEPFARGPYCGSFMLMGFEGNMQSSILIRTLVYQNNQVALTVGGGITTLSKPELEYQETLIKARRLFESFEPQNQQQVAVKTRGAA